MFVPSLAVGAAGGRLFGRLIGAAVKAAGSDLAVSLPAYSVIGGCRGGARFDDTGGRQAPGRRCAARSRRGREGLLRPAGAGPHPARLPLPACLPAGAAAFLGGSTRMTMTTTGGGWKGGSIRHALRCTAAARLPCHAPHTRTATPRCARRSHPRPAAPPWHGAPAANSDGHGDDGRAAAHRAPHAHRLLRQGAADWLGWARCRRAGRMGGRPVAGGRCRLERA